MSKQTEISKETKLLLKINSSYKKLLKKILQNINNNLSTRKNISEYVSTTSVELNIQELGMILNLLNEFSKRYVNNLEKTK